MKCPRFWDFGLNKLTAAEIFEMPTLLAILLLLIVWLLIELRKKCLHEGRPFFSWGKKRAHKTMTRFSEPQRSQQKYSRRSDNSHRNQRYKNRPSISSLQQGTTALVETSSRQDKVSRHLLVRLNSLTRDQATSERLIQSTKVKNPERTFDWCAERAISDIERDRM